MRISARFDRNKISTLLLLTITIILTVISVFYTHSIISRANQSEMPESIYAEDTFSHPIDDFSGLLNHSVTGLVYVGRDSCPDCLVFNRIMQEDILKQYPALTIQKFDTSVWTEHEQYQEVLDIYEITSIPAVIFLRDDGTYKKILMEDMSGQKIVQEMVLLIESEDLYF